jgi:hypothetical protein
MKPPTRWVRSDSESEPVVRAVMRYAQSRGPSAAELEALRQAVLARSESRRPPGRRTGWTSASAALLVAAGMALVVGWMALGRTQTEPALALVKEPLARSGEPAEQLIPQPQPPSSATVTPSVELPTARRVVAPNPSASGPGGEIATLQRARLTVSQKPAVALSLTEQHAIKYPRGEFREERDALRIEALVRLGRQGEATQLFSSFEQQYPRSVYLRRMLPWFATDAAAHQH